MNTLAALVYDPRLPGYAYDAVAGLCALTTFFGVWVAYAALSGWLERKRSEKTAHARS